jgi:hypothetical protein
MAHNQECRQQKNITLLQIFRETIKKNIETQTKAETFEGERDLDFTSQERERA